MKKVAVILLVSLLAAAIIAAGAYAAWHFRLREHTYFTDAQSIREPLATAQVRDVLWQPAESLRGFPNAEGVDDYEPKLSADGTKLFFVRGQAGDNADIFLSTRTPTGWTEPQPLDAVNSRFDDLGPAPSPDGRSLYFYSNRPGGLGGYDIWIAHRTDDDGWTEPVNLGEPVNSVANDYGPAITPDGSVLYFASNRENAEGDQAAPAEGSSNVYDLYRMPLSGEDRGGLAPVAELNTASNEGAPGISPSGDFIYFASDRPGGEGGFDLYRARRLDEQHVDLRNLGDEVNTSANELDPAPDMAGFRLVFSSDRARAPDPAQPAADYDLYQSISREVFVQTERDRAALDWPAIWEALRPSLLWLLVALLLLLVLIQYLRRVEMRRLSLLTKCVLASAFVHLLIMLLMTAWNVTTSLSDMMRDRGAVQIAMSQPSQSEIAIQVRGNLTSVEYEAPEVADSSRQAQTPSLLRPAPMMTSLTVARSSSTIQERMPVEVAVGESMRVESPPVAETPVELPPITMAAASPVELPETPAQQQATEVAAESAREVQPAAVRAANQAESQPLAPAVEAAHLQPDAAEAILPEPTSLAETDALDDVEVTPSTEIAATPLPDIDVPDRPQTLAVATPTSTPSEVSGEPDLSTSDVATTGHEPARHAINGAQAPAPVVVDAAFGVDSPVRIDEEAPLAKNLPSVVAEAPAPSSPTREPEVDQDAAVPSAGPSGELAIALPESSEPDDAPQEVGETNPVIAEAPTSARSGAAPLPFEATGETETLEAAPLARDIARVDAPLLGEMPDDATGDAAPETAVLDIPQSPDIERHHSVVPLPDALVEGTIPRVAEAEERGGRELASGDAPATTERARNVLINPAPPERAEMRIAPGEPAHPSPGPLLMSEALVMDDPEADSEPAPAPDSVAQLAALPVADISLERMRLPSERPEIADPFPQRDADERREVLEEMGGGSETERAVALALRWLAEHQSADGHWDPSDFDDDCGECGGTSGADIDIALTGLSVLAFLAADHTHENESPYSDNVRRALDWLLAEQARDGGLLANETLYSHGIASIALAEAYAMTADPILLDPVERAVEFIVDGPSPETGGWRYAPKQAGDTSVTGWQVMALASAKRGDIDVPPEALDHVRQWIDAVRHPEQAGRYGYQPGRQYTDAMTAEAMFVRQLLGIGRDDPDMHASAQHLLENLPDWDRDPNTYYWYYGTLAMFHYQGSAWEEWNNALKEELIAHQRTDGKAAGSWDPVDQWAQIGGRVYQTAICALSLEIYYRYEPLYATDDIIDIAGMIEGTVTDAESGDALEDAIVALDLPGREALTVRTDAAGRYVIAAPEMPDYFAISAASPGYAPKSLSASGNELRGRTLRRDFELAPVSSDIVSIEDLPEVHHLGNDRYEGAVNSRFQKKTEGRTWRGRFSLAAEQLPPTFDQAELRLMVKGAQAANRIRINGSLLSSRLRYSPRDGRYGEFETTFDIGVLREGANEIVIESSDDLGDLDDFEFVNVQIQLSRRDRN